MAKAARGSAGTARAARGGDCIVASGEKFVVLRVHVKPGSAADAIVGKDPWRGALEVNVKARAEKGEANLAVSMVIAAWFGVRLADVQILRGKTSRDKTVRVAGGSDLKARALVGSMG